MSKCDLTIHFEREDRQYLTGEPVKGSVKV